MPVYTYRAIRADGTVITGRVVAEDEMSLRDRLAAEGQLVFSVRRRGALLRTLISPGQRPSPSDLLIFNQEFLALLKAGLPILRVLDVLIERTRHGDLQDALRAVRRAVHGGAAIAEAMDPYPRVFPELYRFSVRAGERTGSLIETTERYIAYLKQMIVLRRKVVATLTYPTFLLVVGGAVVGFLLFYVMPTFSEIYRDTATDLPWATRLLIETVQVLRPLVPFIAAGLVAAALALQAWSRTPAGRERLHALSLRLPLLGQVVAHHHLVRLTRTLSSVLRSGVPLVPALGIVADAMTNRFVAMRLGGVIERVKEGTDLRAAFEGSGLMPRMTVEMIAVGEATGGLEEMLDQAAEFHEEELDRMLNHFTTWLEPVLLLIMGLFVGTIIVLMYLPIFYLAAVVH